MESENKTVQLPQTSLGMHNLIIDLTVHLNQIKPGLSWDVDHWEIGDDDKLRMHDYVLVVYPDAETGNKINIVCQIIEMCGVGLPALRALETGDRTSIMGTYITNCRLVRIKKPEEKQS